MTTDELLMKLPACIGRNKVIIKETGSTFYLTDNKSGESFGFLYLHNDGNDWCASYGTDGEFVCLNPDTETPPYNNAFCYGKTPQEALQRLYDWCVENGFIEKNCNNL